MSVSQATLFMRQPFFVVGRQVNEENMAILAKWCEGDVITTSEHSYVRVPVDRPTHRRQTEAHVGYWILQSERGGRKSYKVYDEEWLRKSFVEFHGEIPQEVVRVSRGDSSSIARVQNMAKNTPSPALFKTL